MYFYNMNYLKKSDVLFKSRNVRVAFVIAALIFLLTAPMLLLKKEAISLALNQMHHPIPDSFFFYITWLGDGLIFIPVFILLLFRSYVLSAFFAVSIGLEAFIVQVVLKKGIFSELVRPSLYIADFDKLHKITGVDIHSLHTFPSGHSQTVFLVALFLILAYENRPWLHYLLLLTASLTALSRVWLLQHFFVDIWFGGLIGFFVPLILMWMLHRLGKFPASQSHLEYGRIIKSKRLEVKN